MSPDGAAPRKLPLTLALDSVLARCLAALVEDGTARPETVDLAEMLDRTRALPGPQDLAFLAATQPLGLSAPDLMILFTLLRCEQDMDVAQTIAGLQSGAARFRPAAGLLGQIGRLLAPGFDLWRSPLWALEMIEAPRGAAPAVLSPVHLADPVAAALGLPGRAAFPWEPAPEVIPAAWQDHAAAQIARWPRGAPMTVSLRGALPGDRDLYAAALAQAMGRRALALPPPDARPPGYGVALTLLHALPISREIAQAGTRRTLDPLPGFDGPRLALLDGAGAVEGVQWDLTVPTLPEADRAALWPLGTRVPTALAAQGPGRLQAVARRLAQREAGADQGAIRAAAGDEARPDLEPHGQLVRAEVSDAAMVASGTVKGELDLLAARCAARRAALDALGPAFHARGIETGVRALLYGPSGSGKTLACAWLATRLGLPLFKVDLSAVVSKYIGETEENLARILDRAEAADVILLFDEADSLFGARTEVKDSSDRFANNQTNFLLSRIESYDGIVLMTTNGRERIDTAFSRRIDQMIEIPIPDAKERRAIWRAHLGAANGLSGLEMNALAGGADISGGHIRSITATAAVLARQEGRPERITMAEIGPALALEYRKIGRTPPAALVRV